MQQSLLTQAEYDKYSKIYKTYCPTCRKTVEGPPPNYIMGNSFTPSEIKIINARLDAALKKVTEKNEVEKDLV